MREWWLLSGLTALAAVGLVFSTRRWMFDTYVFLSVTTVAINFVGIDPIQALMPVLFFLGLLTRQLRFDHLGANAPAFIAVLAFLTAYVLSNVVSAPVWSEFFKFATNLVACLLIVGFATTKHRMRLIGLGLVTGVLLSALGGAYFLMTQEVPPRFLFDTRLEFRLQGLMGDPNFLGQLAGSLVVWILEEIRNPQLVRGWYSAKLIALAGLIVVAVLCMSRSVWLGLALSLLIYAGWALREGGWRPLGRIFVVIPLVGVLVTGGLGMLPEGQRSLLLDRVSSVAKPSNAKIDDTMEQKRADFYFTKRAARLGLDHPFGTGTGGTTRDLPLINGLPIGAHNAFVQVLADNGWLSFVLFVVLCGWLLMVTAYGALTRTERDIGVSDVVLFCSLIVLVVVGMFQDILAWTPAWMPLAVALAAIAAPRTSPPGSVSSGTRSSNRVPVLIS